MVLAEKLVVSWNILSYYEWFLSREISKKSQLDPSMCFMLSISVVYVIRNSMSPLMPAWLSNWPINASLSLGGGGWVGLFFGWLVGFLWLFAFVWKQKLGNYGSPYIHLYHWCVYSLSPWPIIVGLCWVLSKHCSHFTHNNRFLKKYFFWGCLWKWKYTSLLVYLY